MVSAGIELHRRALITGASGFIGSQLVAGFLQDGWMVSGVDQHLGPWDGTGTERFRFHRVALSTAEFADVLRETRPSLIVHAAGPSSVPISMESPERDFDDNVGLTVNLLGDVRRHVPDCRVVFLSSAAVYGNQSSRPIPEDAPLRPVSPYGYHKAMAEMAIREYASVHRIRGCSVRIFSAYGPGLRRQVMWDICRKTGPGGPVQLHGTGRESRDFVHVRDIATAIRLIAERAPLEGEAYNLGSGVETTIQELAEALLAALGSNAGMHFTGLPRPGDPERWRADLRRVAALGYRPSVALREGVQEYAEWFRTSTFGRADG